MAVIAFFIILALTVFLAFYFRLYFHEVLVKPILLFYTQIRDMINSLPQRNIWFFWLAVLLALMLYSLQRLRQAPPETDPLEPAPSVDSRLLYWNNQVLLLTQGAISSPFAVKMLRHLVLDVVAHDHPLERKEIEQMLRRGEFTDLPVEIQQALLFEAQPRTFTRSMQIWLADTFRFPFLTRRYLTPDADRLQKLDRILSYLEEQLET